MNIYVYIRDDIDIQKSGYMRLRKLKDVIEMR